MPFDSRNHRPSTVSAKAWIIRLPQGTLGTPKP
jgi:hypothetical protein